MSKQNIFDNEKFFEGYRTLRENPDCANNLTEKPALFSMLGEIKGKRILDLGCGYGENCLAFSKMGARSVTGTDISEKMLAVAQQENTGESIRYLHMPMEDISALMPERFDIIVSSLAIHYVENFEKLAQDIYSLLTEGGLFLFSQEHPLTTAPKEGVRWLRSASGETEGYVLTDYAQPGKRCVSWMVDGILKYHRTFSNIVNSLCKAGFQIEEMREPLPPKEAFSRLPSLHKEMHKPNFLLIKARKK